MVYVQGRRGSAVTSREGVSLKEAIALALALLESTEGVQVYESREHCVSFVTDTDSVILVPSGAIELALIRMLAAGALHIKSGAGSALAITIAILYRGGRLTPEEEGMLRAYPSWDVEKLTHILYRTLVPPQCSVAEALSFPWLFEDGST